MNAWQTSIISDPSSGLLWQCTQGNCKAVPPCFGNEITIHSVETFLPFSVVVLGLFLTVTSLSKAIKFEVIHSLYSHLMFWKASPFCNILYLLFWFGLFLKSMQLPWQLLPTLELCYWEFLAWLLFACAARSTVIKQTVNYSTSHLLRQLMWQ